MTDIAQHQHCTRPWYMRPPVWILGLVVVGLVIFAVIESVGRPAATSYGNFLDQLDAGNVASVTFQGNRIDGRFKHAVANTAANGKAPQSFHSRVPEFGDPTLLPELRKQHVAIDVATSSSWTSWLAGLPWPMVVFLGFILIVGVVRYLRGGSSQAGNAQSGSAMPMPGMIGMLAGLFGKQSQSTGSAAGGGQESKSS
jgi:cell division protease FtsH